jgi:hypothetical protein
MKNHAQCGACSNWFLWAQDDAGDWVPLNPKAVPNGSYVLLRDDVRTVPLLNVDTSRLAPDAQARRHHDHRQTCPGYAPVLDVPPDKKLRRQREQRRARRLAEEARR